MKTDKKDFGNVLVEATRLVDVPDDPKAGARPQHEVIVIGAGSAGLATAAMLVKRDVETLLVDRSDAVAASWRSRYDSLKLNTLRWLSHLPGLRMPRSYGDFPSRADYARYLESYLDYSRIPVQLCTDVIRIDRRDRSWLVTTNSGLLEAACVVVATGPDSTPVIPKWPGLRGFAGELIHSSEYRNPAPYWGRSVLVVGGGDSGGDIAYDLAQNGADEVRLSIRTTPQILRLRFLGIPIQLLAIIGKPIPAPIYDAQTALIRRIQVGDLSRYGIGKAPGFTARIRQRRFPIIDRGFISALKSRSIEVVQAVTEFEKEDVILSDGTRVRPDVVIAATGYRTGLEPLVGHLGVLDDCGWPIISGDHAYAATPGLYFMGFKYQPTGALRAHGIDAPKLARKIARDLRRYHSGSAIISVPTPRRIDLT